MSFESLPRATILIVEDDPGIAELEKDRLEESGYRTLLASTAEQAIETLGGNSIDLILLDYRLPGGVDGLDFYASVKAAGYDIPVILVTGFSSEATVIQALRVGVRDFVTKSVEYLDYLPDAVARVLQQVQTEHQLASIIASARDAIISTDRNRRITLFNPAAERMFRCPASAALGRRLTDFIPDEYITSPDGQGTDKSTLSQRLRAGTRGIRSDGEEFPLETSVARGEAGGRRFYTLVVRDVTDRKRAEEALRASNDLLRAVMHGTTDLIYVKDREGRYLMLNSAGATFLGMPVEEVIGRRDSDLLAHETASLARAHDEEVMAVGATRTYEEIATIAGKTRVLLATKSPYRDSMGAVAGVIGISRDITDRKRVEEDREKFFALVEHSAEFIGMASLDEQVFYINPAGCRMVGLEEQGLPAGSHIEHFVPDDVAALYRDKAIPQALAGKRWEGEARFKHLQTGRLIDVQQSIFVVRTPGNGEPMCLATVARDITERRRLEEQLRQAQKMEAVGQLAGGVAHDFNNLLTVINGYSQLILDELPPGDPNRGQVEEVYKAGERAALLTQQLLVFSRRDVIKPQILDSNTVVENSGRMLRRLIGEDIRLSVVPGRNLGLVLADSGQLEQIIMNLAVNARDAMPTGGRLTVETANMELGEDYTQSHAGVRPGRYVLVAVSDTGCGMTEEIRSRIFEPFFTTKEAGKGTGLGLATVYGIVKQAGGHIDVYSEPGQGTTFKVYLPRVEESGAIRQSGSGLVEVPRGSEAVLLVEDEESVRRLARVSLEMSGYTVLEASNGDQAIGIAASCPDQISLVVTDVVMPGMSGRELLDRLRQSRPGLRVLFLSGYTDDAIVRHGILQNEVSFLQKPFTPITLSRKVREVLDSRSP